MVSLQTSPYCGGLSVSPSTNGVATVRAIFAMTPTTSRIGSSLTSAPLQRSSVYSNAARCVDSFRLKDELLSATSTLILSPGLPTECREISRYYSHCQTIWTRGLISEGLLQNSPASRSIRRFLSASNVVRSKHQQHTSCMHIKGHTVEVIIHSVPCHITIIQYPAR